MKLVIDTALQTLHRDGPRTRERLDRLVWNLGRTYDLSEDTIQRLQEEAWQEHLARDCGE